mmetsp:Transcript_23674/g.47072  ORF Transcript_23674/g.47072 Transcript_23674/m.47072 type:complete len:236 (-) Transcript_23674:172-879(-)
MNLKGGFPRSLSEHLGLVTIFSIIDLVFSGSELQASISASKLLLLEPLLVGELLMLSPSPASLVCCLSDPLIPLLVPLLVAGASLASLASWAKMAAELSALAKSSPPLAWGGSSSSRLLFWAAGAAEGLSGLFASATPPPPPEAPFLGIVPSPGVSLSRVRATAAAWSRDSSVATRPMAARKMLVLRGSSPATTLRLRMSSCSPMQMPTRLMILLRKSHLDCLSLMLPLSSSSSV